MSRWMRGYANGSCLRGGWDLNAAAVPEQDLEDVFNAVSAKVNITDVPLAREAILRAFLYDSALVRGDRGAVDAQRNEVKNRDLENPGFKKFFDLVRRVAHAGTEPDEDQLNLYKATRTSFARQQAAQFSNPNYRWYGSAPYDAQTGTRYPYYNIFRRALPRSPRVKTATAGKPSKVYGTIAKRYSPALRSIIKQEQAAAPLAIPPAKREEMEEA